MRPGWRLGLALALLVAQLLAPLPRWGCVEARILGRHTIVGKLFRLTPLGRVVTTVEERQDAYRAANAWLAQQQQANSVRQEDLRQAFVAGKLDLRAYVHGQATLLRHAEQYVDVTERMEKIGHDNFNRAMGQQVFERFMPRIAQSVGFARRVESVQGALEAGRQLLEEGALDIDRLAEKAYPQFLRDGRARVQELMTKVDRAGLSGKPVEDIRRALAGLERGLGALEKAVPEMVKTEDVQRLQEEARYAAQVLANTGKALDDGVKRLRDRNTVYFPAKSAERDAVVKKAMEEFSADASLVRRAIEESKVRRALGPQLEEALERCGVERSDPLYVKIRQRMLGLVDVSGGGPSESDLDALCAEARDQITREAEQPSLGGTATISCGLTDLKPLLGEAGGYGALRWRLFQSDIPPSDQSQLVACLGQEPSLGIAELALDLTVALDTGEMSGSWNGTVCCPRQDSVQGTGTLEGFLTEGTVVVHADGLGFDLQALGETTIMLEAATNCGTPKQGSRSTSLSTEVEVTWRAGEGRLTIRGSDADDNLSFILMAANPPFVIEP